MRRLKHYLILFLERISQVRYEIGFPLINLNDLLSKGLNCEVKFLKHPYKDRWFADPFILEVNDKTITLLVEEFLYSTQKGRIARLTVDRTNYHLLRNELVLEEETHLSFPFIYRINNHVYIYPESSCSSVWKEYEYDVEHNQILGDRVIICEPLTDAILDERGMILSTKVPDTNSSILTVYRREGNSYKEAYCVSFGEKVARNAGAIFTIGNRRFRPAQECNHAYGHAVVIQEFKDNDVISFSERCRLESPHHLLNDGCHTFNTYKGISVIDINGPRNPRLRKLFNQCYKYYQRLRSIG